MDNIVNKQQLNLARKWRPQTFDQIVGQQITVNMLKNSLYVQKYFPVYLFAGQRGCGKTTTARVFGASLNCKDLLTFQQQPNNTSIPCLSCSSCIAMQQGNHPDFIEIDAASHTGVDNVRQLIDASSYAPLLGNKKIYLIDEVHMLSKAAFNALLKILEEPPTTVHFILATTELHKIPQTVLSRCFQLTFNAIHQENLKDHLIMLCKSENIAIDETALDLIISETEGSARDALNLLEQVRFSASNITQDSVLQVLGKVSVAKIIQAFEYVLHNNAEKLLEIMITFYQQHILPQTLWDMFVELCRVIVWVKHGITTVPGSFTHYFNDIFSLATQCSLPRLQSIMQFLWEQEPLFIQTKQKQILLEHTLVQLCYPPMLSNTPFTIALPTEGFINTTQQQTNSSSQQIPTTTNALPHTPLPATTPPLPSREQEPINTPETQPSSPPQWNQFVQALSHTHDQLLKSILLQATFIEFNETTGSLTLELTNNGPFFKEKLQDSSFLWKPLLIEHFPTFKDFFFKLAAIKQQEKIQPSSSPSSAPTNTINSSRTPTYPTRKAAPSPINNNKQAKPRESLVPFNISDTEKWPLSNLIISHFPGKLVKEKNFS